MDRPVAAGPHPLTAAPGRGIRLRVRVQPRASRSEIGGMHGGELRIRLMAPPVDGAANQALVWLLARVLKVPRAAVTIAGGHASRSKLVEVAGISTADACLRLGLRADDAPLHRTPPGR